MGGLGTRNLTTLRNSCATQSNYLRESADSRGRGEQPAPFGPVFMPNGRGGALRSRPQRDVAEALCSSRSGSSGTRQQFSRYRAAQASTTAAANVITAVSASWRGTLALSEPAR